MTTNFQRRHTTQGDWWPRKTGTSEPARYGVMETSGYDNLLGPRFSTTYHVIDLETCGTVVQEFRAAGRPGSLKTQLVREEACTFAHDLNRLDRAHSMVAV